ncbi:MAG: hypothetical protein CFE29_14125 [Bradyrhizobiaceae bacterium PARB1]|jgi:hypothetical protein|nr:MAG: hypothetical protein CFE29_14125 [Bradyrhizobiaceae bacterium PARB1]
MDLDYIHSQFLAAAGGIAKGKGVTEVVLVGGAYGQQVRINQALQAACQHLREVLHAEDSDVVKAAFHAFDASPPSDLIHECADSLLKLSELREPRDPTTAPFRSREFFQAEFTRESDNKLFKADVSYTTEFPRTYEAKVRFADDGQLIIRDQLRGPLVDIEMDDELLRESVVQAVQEKINTSDA